VYPLLAHLLSDASRCGRLLGYDTIVLEAAERNGRVDILDAFGPGSGVGSALATPARAYQTAVDRSL
jgi:hypothetical protein